MKIRDQVILLAAAGIVLIGGTVTGFALQGGGARAGREFAETVQANIEGDRTTVDSMLDSEKEKDKEPEQGIKIEFVMSEGEKNQAEQEGEDEDNQIAGEEQKIDGSIQLDSQLEVEENQDVDQERLPDGAGNQQINEDGTQKSQEQQVSGQDLQGDKIKNPDRNAGEIVMLFAGDVYLSDHVLTAYDNAGGIHGVLDEGIRAEIEKADIFMVNQEFPFTERGTAAEDKQFTFRVPQKRMSLMKEMGIDIVTLANNHILDFGEEGLLDSCKALDEAGILYVGGGKDFERASALKTMIIGEKTIGFLGTSRVYMDVSWAAGVSHPGVFSTYDTTWPLKAIKKAKEECDFLVVYVHWGVEKKETPEEYQKAMGRAYIDAGADLVVGSHPHVLQEIEEYKGKTIVYSLGNFVFGSSIPKTALLKVVWGHGGTEISMIPCTSSKGFTRIAP